MMTREEIEELKGLAASMGLYDDKNPCKRALILGKAIKVLEQETCENNICDSCHTKGCIFQSGIKRVNCEFYTAQNEPCNDAISRESLLNKLCGYQVDIEKYIFDKLWRVIKDMPSVTPQEPKTGHWTYICNSSVNGLKIMECSECGTRTYGSGSFCPYCGAKMVEPQEEKEAE